MKQAIIFATIAMGIIGFSRRDFTTLTFRKLSGLWGIYMTLSLLAFVCSLNPYLGLLINLLTLFTIVYVFVSEYEEQVYYPFVMYFIYMQVNPISIVELPLRLALTTFGVGFMVGLLFMIQKKQNEPYRSMTLLIDHVLQDEKLDQVLMKISKTIYRKRKANYYISLGDRKCMNIAFALERLSKMRNRENEEQMKEGLLRLKAYIQGEEKELISMKETNDIAMIYNYILKNFQELERLKKKKKIYFNESWAKEDDFSLLQIFKRNFNLHSLKFSFASKMAISLAVLNGITQVIGIAKISWVMITVMVLLQPYLEDTLLKGRNRLKGAAIGCITFGIIFNIFQSPDIRVLIIVGAALLYMYVKEYDKKQIFMTFITVGTAAFTYDVNWLIPRRIVFILIGILIAYWIAVTLFPYRKVKGKQQLEDKLKESLDLIYLQNLKAQEDQENLEYLRNLVLKAIMISHKLGESAQEEIIDACCTINESVLIKYMQES